MDYQFQKNSKFALLAFSSVFADLPTEAFRLSDDKTWIMPRVPVTDPGIWKEWLGTVRMEHLGQANLVLFVEEPSDTPDSSMARTNGSRTTCAVCFRCCICVPASRARIWICCAAPR